MTVPDHKVVSACMFAHISVNRDREIVCERTAEDEAKAKVEDETPFTIQMVADIVGCSDETIRRRLEEYEYRGVVHRVDDGGRAKKYTFTADRIKVERIIR